MFGSDDSTFRWHDFLDVAEELLTSPNVEQQAYLRTVVGRTYYGTYGTLRQRLQSEVAADFGTSGRHGPLAAACSRSTDAHIAGVGKRLQRLKAYRVQADYSDPPEDLTIADAENAVDTAHSLLDRIQKLAHSQLTAIRQDLGL